MKINNQNIRAVFSNRELRFHDYIYENLLFMRNDTIKISLLNNERKKYELLFKNVIGCEFTSCDFWGASPRVDCASYNEEKCMVIIPKLYKQFENTPYKKVCRLHEENTYIEFVLNLISGDKLIIACESFYVSKELVG